jgi:drug/metabolite transporter (DMT)-like permease
MFVTKPIFLPLLVSVFVTLVFSGHYLAAKEILTTVPALSLAAARGIVGGLVLLVIFWPPIKAHIAPTKILALCTVAAVGFCCNQLLLLAGLQKTTPADAALISSTIPIVASILAVFLRIDSIDKRRFLGIVIGLLTICWYLLHLFVVDLTAHAHGNLLVFANVFLFCGALVIVKKFLKEVPAEVVATGMLLLGGIGLLAAGGQPLDLVSFARKDANSFAIIFFEVIVTTAIAYTLNLWVLKRLSIATTTVFNYLQPPFTAILAWAFLGSEPTWALALAFLGITIACTLVLSAEQLGHRSDH